jgi:hypothetical protein
LAHRTAVEHVRVARAVAAHPPLAAGMAAGRLSYSQVRAISRVADLGDATMLADLINLARHGTVGQLEDTVRGLRTVEDQHRDPAGRREPYLRRGWNDESQYRLSARLDPEDGALVDAALGAVAASDPQLSRAAALVRLAELGLAALREGSDRRLRQDQTTLLVHVDARQLRTEPEPSEPAETEPAETLAATDAAPGNGTAAERGTRSRERAAQDPAARPAGRIHRGPGLSEAMLRRLLCAGRIRPVLRDGKNVLDLGRTRRLVSTKQFQALLLRADARCQAPGCTHRNHLHAHHVRHWIDGGTTDLSNLILLCSRHHRALHDGTFTITAHGDGTFTFHHAHGRPWPQHPDTPTDTSGPVENEHPVPPAAATTHWDGTRLHPDEAIWGIARHLHSERARSRERAA